MTHEARIESLENQIRTLKRMLIGLFGLVVFGGLLAATSLQNVPDVIQAKKFEVVSSTGKEVLSLSSDAKGGQIQVCNQQEVVVGTLGAKASGCQLEFLNRKGKIKTVLAASKEWGGGLMFMSDCMLQQGDLGGGMPSIAMMVDPQSGASLNMFSSTDALSSSAIQIADGKSFFGIEFLNSDGDIVSKLGVENGSTGLIKTYKPKKESP